MVRGLSESSIARGGAVPEGMPGRVCCHGCTCPHGVNRAQAGDLHRLMDRNSPWDTPVPSAETPGEHPYLTCTCARRRRSYAGATHKPCKCITVRNGTCEISAEAETSWVQEATLPASRSGPDRVGIEMAPFNRVTQLRDTTGKTVFRAPM